MIPLILGFVSASLFLGLSMAIYGTGVLAESPWVLQVLFGLIGSGLVVYAINRPTPAWLCRLLERAKPKGETWETTAPCGC